MNDSLTSMNEPLNRRNDASSEVNDASSEMNGSSLRVIVPFLAPSGSSSEVNASCFQQKGHRSDAPPSRPDERLRQLE
jgi:hypothetical protein